jgi:NAD(P)-dependent dehydrogenase (short-subunit alcohol dehydrogenase family)
MKGKVVVITGANVGIGKETAVGLARKGATTVLACRNQEKAKAAADEVAQRTGNDDVHVVSLDLSDLASVRDCASAIEGSFPRLDVLVNNAGGIWSHRQLTAQGFEQTFGVNHLGHFYLTNLLLPRLIASAPARIINVTSVGHHYAFGGMNWADLQLEHGYSAMGAYSQSKLANILFTRALAKRVSPSQVTANAVHPGPVRSGFGMDGDLKGIVGLGNKIVRLFEISSKTGARTSIMLASSPKVQGRTGGYWRYGFPGIMSHAARSDQAAERLWEESEHLLKSAGFAPVPGG